MDKRIDKPFRGKRVDNGEWVYGVYLDESHIGVFYSKAEYDSPFVETYSVQPETVGEHLYWAYDNTEWDELSETEQREWLKNHTSDRWHGKRIYEGDIVSVKVYDESTDEELYNYIAVTFFF